MNPEDTRVHEAYRWAIARQRLVDDQAATLLLWAISLVCVFATVLIVAAFRDITISGWDIFMQIARWYAGGTGVWATAVYLPLYIAHGQTRRAFLRQLPVFALPFVAILAGLATLGYAIERGAYTLAGWQQGLSDAHLFDAATEYPLILGQFSLVFVAWTSLGVLLGAAFYRNAGLGLAILPPSLALIALLESATGEGFIPWATDVLDFAGINADAASFPAALGVTVVTAVAAYTGSWAVIRDLPLRSKHA